MIDNLNYNPLGQLGPVYPRPEYRPPNKEDPHKSGEAGQDSQTGVGANKTKDSGLKANQALKAYAWESAKIAHPESRLNLAAAQALTEETAASIARLPAGDTNSGPHRLNPYWGLFGSKYV
jgi:hypothetical protein